MLLFALSLLWQRQKCWLMIMLVESTEAAGHPYLRRITMHGLDMRADGRGFSWVDHETIRYGMRGAFRSSRRPKCTAKACLLGFATEDKTKKV